MPALVKSVKLADKWLVSNTEIVELGKIKWTRHQSHESSPLH